MTARAARTIPRTPDLDAARPEERQVALATDLTALYRTEASRLRSFFSRRTPPHEAEDLVQESFARLAARAENCAAPDRPAAYVQQVATNLLRSRARTALRRSFALHVPADETALAGPDPLVALEARDQLARVAAALHRLTPKTRAIFLAHRIDGLTYNEIAVRTGLGVKTVEWHMTKAIAHLDRALARR